MNLLDYSTRLARGLQSVLPDGFECKVHPVEVSVGGSPSVQVDFYTPMTRPTKTSRHRFSRVIDVDPGEDIAVTVTILRLGVQVACERAGIRPKVFDL